MPFDSTTYPETETQTEHDLRILRAAREGISKPGGWCQTKYEIGHAKCAVGWIADACGTSPGLRSVTVARELLGPDLPKSFTCVVDYNDNRTQKAVVKLFSRAIARLERERDA